MFCPNCGTQNDDNGVKCQKCGFNLKGAAAPKFKGTMLMMNSPMAQAPRPAAPAGAPPGQAPWPKSAAKATMIGVAPPSPGAVAPPNRSPVAPPVVPAAGAAPAPTGQAIPRPVPPAVGGTAPVNPFGGTMLMGAMPAAQPAPAAAAPSLGAELPPTDRTVASEGAPLPNIPEPAKLESTTPSAAPAPKAVAATQNEIAVFGTADTAPPPGANFAPAPEFPKPAATDMAPLPVMPASASQPRAGKIRPIGLVVVLGFVTFGIYWLIAMLGALKDFNAIRQKNDVNPILFIIPILGLLETIKLPKKMVETRAAVGVSNPVAPNVVLYILFPQIFFIADLNELVEAANRRTSIS